MADNNFARREIRHRENTKWKYGLTRAARAEDVSIACTHQTDITPMDSDWSIGQSRVYHARSHALAGLGIAIWNSEFGIFSVSFCHHLGLSKLMGLLHLLRFFHTHCPRGNGCKESGETAHRV